MRRNFNFGGRAQGGGAPPQRDYAYDKRDDNSQRYNAFLDSMKYEKMSNLVLKPDRRLIEPRAKDEATGMPESISGRFKIREMGQSLPSMKKRRQTELDFDKLAEDVELRQLQQRKQRGDDSTKTGATGILNADDFRLEGLTYFPKSAATRDIYDKMAHIVSRYIGDETVQVLRSATDSVIESLMRPDVSANDRRAEIEDILGPLAEKNFNELVNLSRRIDDFDFSVFAQADGEDDEVERTDRILRDIGTGIILDDDDEPKMGPIDPPNVQDYTKGIIDVSTPAEVAGFKRLKLKAKKAEEDGEDATMQLQEDIVDTADEDEDEARVSRTPSTADVHSRDWMFEPDALKKKLREIGGLEEENASELALKTLSVIRSEIKSKGLALEDDQLEEALIDVFEQDELLSLIPDLVANKNRIILKQMWDDAYPGNLESLHEIELQFVASGDQDFLDAIWASKWNESAGTPSELARVEQDMITLGHKGLLDSLKLQHELKAAHQETQNGSATMRLGSLKRFKQQLENAEAEAAATSVTHQRDHPAEKSLKPRALIDLDGLAFDKGNSFMSTRETKLPKGSKQEQHKNYTEIRVPPPEPKRDASESHVVPVSDLPGWAQKAFGNAKSLNRIQSKCFPVAFENDDNMLVCAPTGSGKTNVAMLAMLREIGKHRNPNTGDIALDDFKIVYIAPLKALVAEQVGNFGKRLEPYGIKVSELTGDRQLTKQQIAETQIIVTTPEKWDVITRKATDTSYTHLVRLICIDEVHLLHDERGPVIESIVTRTIRRTLNQNPVRLVALSATLPNYLDVADFLQVEPDRGLFFFDNSYRPCPLRQEYVGVSQILKPIKQVRLMDEICYKKVLEQVGKHRNQMIIFVHSRKETARLAKYIKNKVVDEDEIGQIIRPDAATREVLQHESQSTSNPDLKDLLPYGFAIHHAGMTRTDRTTVEDLFAERHVQVLVSTATLAWGVNLPAHTVVIKGTQVYSPEKGSWVPLSPQDVLQMLGRAGRPQYDTYGEGIIITSMDDVKYYLSLLNEQLPIESQLLSKLPDSLNAEIVLGNVRNRDEGADWLETTYLYVRMLAAPGLYGLGAEDTDDLNAGLPQRRVDLIHTAATVLHKCNLVDYNPETGAIKKTELGTIASHYYITHNSMATYKDQLDEFCGIMDLFRIFSMSEEFKQIPIRHDEKEELDQIINRVPIPIKETRDEPLAKINLLLQTYISRLKLEGFALVADMVYITQSAGRLLRAIFEICLKRGWARPTRAALTLCQMVEHRMWSTQSPLRQFPRFRKEKSEIINRVERINVRWRDYLEYKDDLPRMGELIGDHKNAREVANWVARFPYVEVHAQAQPITRSQLHITLEITPSFEWVDEVHGAGQLFWILIENDEGRKILFHDQVLIKKEFMTGELSVHHVDCMVVIETPLPPCYFVTVVADRWMGSVTRHPLMLDQLIIPEKFDRPTRFDKNLAQVQISDLRSEHRYLYPNMKKFNVLQSHCFTPLYEQDDDIFIGASNLASRIISAELALLRHWSVAALADAPAVYVAPFQAVVDIRLKDWAKRFGDPDGLGKRVAKLVGDVSKDLRVLAENDLVLATPIQWDLISRQWQRRQRVQSVGIFIADEVHLIGSQGGHIYEAIITRMMNMRDLLEEKIAERGYTLRFVGLSVPVANSSDLADFLGAFSNNFNFEPRLRSVPLVMEFQQYSIPHFPSLMLAMAKPAYNTILESSPATPVIIFVPNRRYARSTAAELLTICDNLGNRDRFLPETDNDYSAVYDKINETALHVTAMHGIGYYHSALDKTDKGIIQRLFQAGALQVLIVTRDCCWEVQADAHLVIIMGTQYYEGKEHRYVDYSVPDIIQMLSKATKPDPGEAEKRVRGVVMLPTAKVSYYKKFLSEPFPVESQLYTNVADSFMSDIVSRNFETTQNALDWITFSFLYRRVQSNPSYYGVSGQFTDSIRTWFENDVVEATLTEMAEAKVIEYEDEQITPLAPLQIAAHYSLSFVTIQTMLLSLNAKSNHRVVLEVVCAATELADIPLRRNEEAILREMYEKFRPRPSRANTLSAEFKAFMLLVAHFRRAPLNIDLEEDRNFIVKKAYDLLGACVDVLASEGHLNAQRPIEIMQFVVQGMFDDDSVLKQIPGFGNREVEVAKKHGIDDIEGFMNAMDPDENPDYGKLIAELGFDHKQLQIAADFTNDYWPEINMTFSMDTAEDESLQAGEQNMLSVEITRGNFDEDGFVHAPLFPEQEKKEAWFVLIGDANSNRMFGIRRFALSGETTNIQLPFVIDEPGDYELVVTLMSGDYVGTDLEQRFQVSVVEQMEVDE